MLFFKKNNLLILLLLTITFNAFSMDKQPDNTKMVYGWDDFVGHVTNCIAAFKQLFQSEPEQKIVNYPHLFITLPKEINDTIINLLSINNSEEDFFKAKKTLQSLACVNHALNNFINHPQFCLNLIKSFTQKHDHSSDEETCWHLGIKEAKNRMILQREFITFLYSDETPQYHYEELYNRGVDLEFLYRDSFLNSKNAETPLMGAPYGSNEVLIYLLHKGVNVNQSDKRGRTALMVASLHRKKDAVEKLIQNKKIAINQQDLAGNTALLYSMEFVPYGFSADLNIIKLLLDAGADPELGNFKGETPLSLFAKKKTRSLIKDAIAKKHGH